MPYSTPHLEKLLATLNNDKLPEGDKPRVEQAVAAYRKWIRKLNTIAASNGSATDILLNLVQSLNEYRFYVDVDLVFDSPNNFLYRQKGQLKLDNSVIEEFLPRLIHPTLVPEIQHEEIVVGPTKAYSAVYFESSLDVPVIGGGLAIRTKDQDFAICKRLYLKASHIPTYEQSAEVNTNLAYVVAECKTNLDKTMFQEVVATAHDVKSAVPGARYYLLCEWLDMTPLSTAPTDIDEVLILRKARRLGAHSRRQFDTYEGRQRHRDRYIEHLRRNSLRTEMFQRFINHVRELLSSEGPDERDVLSLGYF